MGTRGLIGIRIGQKDFLTYNHFDSYPDGLGNDVVEFVRKNIKKLPKLKEKALQMRFVKEDSKPDAATIAKAKKLKLLDLGVGSQSADDWYCVLRGAQGNIGAYLDLGVMTDSNDFALDSLFCEYAYILNFDTDEIEFYKGFNNSWEAEGRYAAKAEKTKTYPAVPGRRAEPEVVPNEYAGIALVGTAPLADIPADWQAKFYKEDEEEVA